MKTTKRYAEVQIGESFQWAGWTMTIVEIAPNGRKYWAETPIPGRERPMRREFSAEIGEMYYGEPDPEPKGDE